MHSRQASFWVVGVIVLATLLSAPLALYSMFSDLFASEVEFRLVGHDAAPAPSYTRLKLEIVALDEVQRVVTLRASGNHVCSGCTHQDKITFYSIPGALSGNHGLGVPPSASISLPATSDTISADLKLPAHGNLVRYPFDVHPLLLGVTMQRVGPDGSSTMLSSDEARGHLFVDLRSELPRMAMDVPREVDPAAVQPRMDKVDYLFVRELRLRRPLYLQLVVPMVAVLIAAASAYAVLMRPFDQLILNSGSLVLGVWGVRSLLLGNYPPNVTLIDLFLTVVIVFLLCSTSLRALNVLHAQAELGVLPWARRKVEPESDVATPQTVPARAH